MFIRKKIFAGRAAIQTANTIPEMTSAIILLYKRVLSANVLEEKNIISIHFSLTSDLTAANPATILRSAGYVADTPLFCSTEPAVDGSPQGLIRILFYYYGRKKAVPVYLGGAENLRPDLFIHK